MWPMRPEMTRDECKKCLRRLESDAYGSMVSVLRAQGPFTNDKQKLLQELAKVLNISNERHRSEVRRVVNDDMLATIAEQLNGPNTGTDWAIESRRTIPLMPRLKARSAFTTLANSLSLATTIADERKPNKHVIPRWHGNSTATETESQSEVQTEENLSVHTKLCNLENDLDSKILEEISNSVKNEKKDDKDIANKVSELPKISRLPEKRKLSPLPTAPPNKVLVVSKTTSLDHNFWPVENEQAPSTTTHQNVAVIPSNIDEISANSNSKESIASEFLSGHTASNKIAVTTVSVCTSNTSAPTTVAGTVKNKVSTKIDSVPSAASIESSSTLNTPLKEQLENKDVQSQGVTNIFYANNTQKNQRSENTNSNPSCNKQSMASIIHEAIMSSTPHRLAAYPNATISSGPGPPQIKQSSETLMCKKLPSEQITINFNQSTAKTGATINSKKVVNIPHYPNAKLNTKTNVIVIQKGHTKGVTLSHAGKEILGKVIIGGKNLCVTSQHNANSVNVQPHHISLNNGNQTKTVLPTANSPQNAESVKTNSGKTAVVSVVTTHLRHDLTDKSKTLSQLFDSPDILNSESKTVILNTNARLPKEECNNDANTIDRESSLKTDAPVDAPTLEEKQHRNNKDVNESIKSQIVNFLDSSNTLESREVLVRQKQLANTIQDDAGSNIRIEDSDENMDAFGATLDTTDINLENFQYLVDNDDSHVLEESMRSIVTINQVNEHNDS